MKIPEKFKSPGGLGTVSDSQAGAVIYKNHGACLRLPGL